MKENNDVVGIEIAKLARKKGFTEICNFGYCYDLEKSGHYLSYDIGYFDNTHLFAMHYAAPSRSALAAWLRKNNIYIDLDVDQTFEPKFAYKISKFVEDGSEWINLMKNGAVYSDLYRTYEAALEASLLEAINSL
jgi:hypothetical protein